MLIVEHSTLPTFRELRRQGHQVLTREDAQRQDIRALHVGLLNMMPDANGLRLDMGPDDATGIHSHVPRSEEHTSESSHG